MKPVSIIGKIGCLKVAYHPLSEAATALARRDRNQLGSLFRLSFLANQTHREIIPQINIVVNWFEELKEKVPAD
jgi:hypothetical protein